MTHLGYGLFDVSRITDAQTRSISAENPDGRPSGGAQAAPEPSGPSRRLGKGWKVRPCITLPGASTTVLADIAGPGAIRHIWMTVDAKAWRDLVLRMYWDGERDPSVEAPLGDFYACGHCQPADVMSLPVAAYPRGGLSSYWPMPFASRARIEVANERTEPVAGFFYQITYELGGTAPDAGRFHAQWRRSVTTLERPEHTILSGVRGKGHYVGTYLAWTQLSNGWWGEGEIKFFIDGDPADAPTICGTGTEDYFTGAWGFDGPPGKPEQAFTGPFAGQPLCRLEPNEVPRHGLYRWHVLDPVRFSRDLAVTIQALGWWPDGTFQPLQDDIASVGYWYQAEPHAAFPALPPRHLRWPR